MSTCIVYSRMYTCIKQPKIRNLKDFRYSDHYIRIMCTITLTTKFGLATKSSIGGYIQHSYKNKRDSNVHECTWVNLDPKVGKGLFWGFLIHHAPVLFRKHNSEYDKHCRLGENSVNCAAGVEIDGESIVAPPFQITVPNQ